MRRLSTALAGWRALVDAAPAQSGLLPDEKWKTLSDAERLAREEARMIYHSEMLVMATSTVTRVAQQGLLATIINRRETGARRVGVSLPEHDSSVRLTDWLVISLNVASSRYIAID